MLVTTGIIGIGCSKALAGDAQLLVREEEGPLGQHAFLKGPGPSVPCRSGHFVFNNSGDGEELAAVDGLLKLHLPFSGDSAEASVGVLTREGNEGYGGALVDEIHHGELLGLFGFLLVGECVPVFLIDAESVDLEGLSV